VCGCRPRLGLAGVEEDGVTPATFLT
jgi:hypothetical protein